MIEKMTLREYCKWLETGVKSGEVKINAQALEMDMKERMWEAYKASNDLILEEDLQHLRPGFEKWYKKQQQ